MAADFRRFYGISIWDIPKTVPWVEAILLFKALMNNTESVTLAKINQYPYTFNKSDMLLMDTYDLILAANSEKKTDGYPRPWDAPKRINKGTIPLSVAIDFFARLGHK